MLTIKTVEKRVSKYPYLGQFAHGTIILFTAKTTGVVVQSKNLNEIGYYSDGWQEENCTEYFGDVVITSS